MMSLQSKITLNNKSTINCILSIDEIKDLKERGFKHWEKYLIPHCEDLLQSTYSEEYIQEKIKEKYQLMLSVSTISMLRKKYLARLGLLEAKRERASFSSPFRIQLIITFK